MDDYTKMKFDNKITLYKHVIFHDEVILETVKIEDEIEDIIFEDCIFIKPLKCVHSTIENEIHFEDCTFREKINMNNGFFEKKVSFINNSFEKNINFIKTIFKYKLYIKKCEVKNISKPIKINFRRAEIFDLKITECQNVHLNFTKSVIEGYLNIKEKIQKSETNFKDINFVKTHFTNNSKITLENLNIEALKLDTYSNHAKNFKFKTLNRKKYIFMQGITFENEKFIDINLNLCEKIRLRKVFITENLFINIKWGVLDFNRFCVEEKNFRELKDFSENKKNYKEAEGFYALEMKKRRNNFIEEEKGFSFFKKIKHYFYNVLILDINEITSNYFQSWILPLLWIFIFGMSVVLYKEYQELLIQNNNIFCFFIILLTSFFTMYHYFKDVINMVWTLFIVFVIIYLYSGHIKEFDYLDKLVEYINPFKIFKFHLESYHLTFPAFIYKIGILFLGYQFLMSIKKKVRNK